MNYLDLALCVPLIWGAWRGFSKGLIIEVASLIALVLGIYGGLRFSGFASDWISAQWELEASLLPIVSFAVTFIAIVVAIYALAKMLEKVVNLVALKLVNKVSGAAFGLLKTGLILSVVLVLLQSVEQRVNILPEGLKEGSLLYGPIAGTAPLIMPILEDSGWYDSSTGPI